MQLIQTTATPAVIDFLKQDEILNLNMFGLMKSTPDAPIYVDDLDKPTGVLIRQNDYFNYLYTKNNAFLDAVCSTFMQTGYHGFSGVDHPIADYILSKSEYTEDWHNPCQLYYLPKENFNPSLQKTPAKPLTVEWVEKVDTHYPYRGSHSMAAITDDIESRPSAAVYIDDEPVCWVMMHEDDSMGIMHTMEEHRRKGYAVDVTIELCRQILDKGEMPFLQIVEGNDMSPGLALKCGFVPYGIVDWFGIVVKGTEEND